jgi:hypothetical protein
MVYWSDKLSIMRPISRAARPGAVFTVTSLKGPIGCITPFVCDKAMAKSKMQKVLRVLCKLEETVG